MDKLEEANRRITDLEGQVTTLTESNTALTTERDGLKQDNARLAEAVLVRTATDKVHEALAEVELPAITKRRLAESIASNPPTTEDGNLDEAKLTTAITEAVKKEVAYLVEATGGDRITGAGGGINLGDAPKLEESTKRATDAFTRLGMPETTAKIAAEGR